MRLPASNCGAPRVIVGVSRPNEPAFARVSAGNHPSRSRARVPAAQQGRLRLADPNAMRETGRSGGDRAAISEGSSYDDQVGAGSPARYPSVQPVFLARRTVRPAGPPAGGVGRPRWPSGRSRARADKAVSRQSVRENVIFTYDHPRRAAIAITIRALAPLGRADRQCLRNAPPPSQAAQRSRRRSLYCGCEH